MQWKSLQVKPIDQHLRFHSQPEQKKSSDMYIVQQMKLSNQNIMSNASYGRFYHKLINSGNM